jgi:hypothetical protein
MPRRGRSTVADAVIGSPVRRPLESPSHPLKLVRRTVRGTSKAAIIGALIWWP